MWAKIPRPSGPSNCLPQRLPQAVFATGKLPKITAPQSFPEKVSC